MRSTDRPDIASLQLIREYQSRLKKLHTIWKPYPGQMESGKLIFQPKQNRRIVMLQCGRKWGKTEFLIYCCWRYALMHPRSNVYIIYPERSQASEIVWADRRLQDFGPREYLSESEDGESKSELRIRFKNGSFIKLEGSENYNRLRGYTPDFVGYDEYKDHHPQAHLSMKPNLIAKQAQLLIAGTPPDVESHYTEMREWILEEMAAGNYRYYYRESPSWENPDELIQAEIEEERRIHTKRGTVAEFLREYGAQYIPGGAGAVFPQFDPKRHMLPAHRIQDLIKPDKKKLNYYCLKDPGTSTCFAVLLAAHNPYTSQIYILGEIYEKDRKNTIVSRIWPRISEMMANWYDDDEKWDIRYDEAAASYAEEFMNFLEGEGREFAFSPTQKVQRDKNYDIGLIKSLMAEPNRLFVNDECEWLKKEVQNYVMKQTATGLQYQKDNDHLVDLLRYLMAACNYRLIEAPDPEDNHFKVDRAEARLLTRSVDRDMRDELEQQDFTLGLFEPYYDEVLGQWWM